MWGDKQNNSFGLSKKLRQPEGEERREKRRGRRGRRRRRRRMTKQRYGFLGFCMESCIFWISRLFGMDYWTFIWISMVLGFLI